MKKFLVFSIIFLFAFSFNTIAQIVHPVKWSVVSKRISKDEADLILTAKIDKGWHMYSQFIPEGGALPTVITLEKSKEYNAIGKATEPKPIEEFDKNFNMMLKFFENSAVLHQKVKLASKKSAAIKGAIEFMCCNDKSCTPDDYSFEVKIDEYKGKDTVSTIKAISAASVDTTVKENSNQDSNKTTAISPKADSVSNSLKEGESKDLEKKSLWGFFFFAFMGGLIALLTPCIYPMIPMTVCYFMNNAHNRAKSITQASIYGVSIVGIYVLIGTVVAVTLGEGFSNWLSTHWIPNVFFFLIFLVFAASFFGMFELTLPSWLINKTDKQADKGGFLGAFFMAFTLVLVSFSCTAPIVGSILSLSVQGQVIRPIVGMLGFSLAFAIPFTAFAVFPNALQSLPKSGSWLNSVKVILGFIELALGLKFLSVADQTYHWGLLDREVYLAIWIVIFTLVGLYLLGKLKFAHDSEIKHVTVPRLLLAIASFSFVVYMVPGMFGAPLKVLSGWTPPMETHEFDLPGIIRENSNLDENCSNNAISELCETPKYDDKLKLPHGIKGYFDLQQALKCSKATGKPVLIDFTGHACVNCRAMEQNVWSEPQVLKRLREDYIVVSLYVDDKAIKLPENEWYTSKYDGKLKKTLGDKNFDYQKSEYKVNGQPYYILVDGDGKMLVKPRTFNLNIDAYSKFLDEGKAEFKKRTEKK